MTAEPHILHAPHVLYAEDEPGLARLVQRRLGRSGYTVSLVASVEDAVAALAENCFDVVLTDYRLADGDGLDIIRTARHCDAGVPLVMVSGSGDIAVAVEAMKLGADDYMIKDVEGAYLDLLPTVLARILEQRRLKAEVRRIETELAAERALSRVAIDSIGQGLAVFDAALDLQLCNRQFLELGGYPEAFGRRGTAIETLLRHNLARGVYGSEAADAELDRRLARARAGEPFEEERDFGDGRVIESRGRPMPGGGLVITYTDVTERRLAERKIWHQAHYDGLTGVANRSLFHDLLARQISHSARTGECFAVLFIDLDGFKAVNDTLGHEAGDQLLKEVAARLVAGVRCADVVARLGGDEFTVILVDVSSPDRAGPIAGHLIEALSRPYRLAGGEARISASIGIACHPEAATTDDGLVRKADAAMYAAKLAGKGRWHVAP
jgi:diguanylate cyclase (GGDEF)-like protein